MSEWKCEKRVRTGNHEGFEYEEAPCGKPAKYALSSNGMPPIGLCGIHARKYLKARKPWQKITPLKREAKP